MQTIFRGLIKLTFQKSPLQSFATSTVKKTKKQTEKKSEKKSEKPTEKKTMRRTKKPASADDATDSKGKKKLNVKKQQSLNSFFTVNAEKKAQQSEKMGELGTGIFQNQETLLISSWNVNGIRAVLNKDKKLLEQKEEKKKEQKFLTSYIEERQPDIFCINESKIDQSMFDKDNVYEQIPFRDQYYSYWNFCKPPTKGYSGVAVFSKVPAISVQNDLGIHKHDQEGRLITLEYPNFYLCAVYVPNAGQGLKRLDYRTKEWDKDFQSHLNKLKEKKHVILTGDLNVAHHEIDLANPKGNVKSAGFTPQERDSFTKFLDYGWIDTFRHLHPDTVKYSYFSMRSGARATGKGWRLDYFVVNEKFMNNVVSSDINNDYYGSDHTPIEMVMQNITKQENQQQQQANDQSEQKQQIEKEQEIEEKQENQNSNDDGDQNPQVEKLQIESEKKELDLSEFAYKRKRSTSKK